MGSSPSPREQQGLALGRYKLLRKLGAGSMGAVYLAHDTRTGERVALKVIRADRLGPAAAARLQEEFRAISSLRHPRIAAARDFGYTEDKRFPYYTREYIAGKPLAPGPPAGVDCATQLQPILDLLEALDYLHANGVLHLDIHPGNLIVADDAARGSVLIDFGLVPSPAASHGTASWGSLAECPPELRGQGAIGPAADIFLVGRLLLHRLTGRTAGEARWVREIPGWSPRAILELERITARALSAAPERRFHSAAAFREALVRALGLSTASCGPAEPRDVLIGREAELEWIDDILRRVLRGESAAGCIAAGWGLGKSRLLRETRVRAQLLGLDVIEAAFRQSSSAGPELASVLRASRAGRGTGSSWVDCLAPAHGGTPVDRARRAAESYFQEDGEPLVLVLDDIEAADRESRALVEALLREVAHRQELGLEGRALGLIVSAGTAEAAHLETVVVRTLRPLRAATSSRLLGVLLGPHDAPQALLRQVLAQSRGSPLRLRRAALSIRRQLALGGPWTSAPVLERLALDPSRPIDATLDSVSRSAREVLSVLSALRRPTRSEEVAAALDIDLARAQSELRALARAELIDCARQGRVRLYRAVHPDLDPARLEGPSPRTVHRRVAAWLERHAPRDARTLENLARHRLAAGRADEGRRLALRAAEMLRREGALERATTLLEEALSAARGALARLETAEQLSSVLEEAGDHARGIALLEALEPAGECAALASSRTRLRRRLGVHYHRAGRSRDALRVFEEARRDADASRDAEELTFIDSELAEIYTLQGLFPLAREACERGLERLRHLKAEPAFRSEMAVTLHASLGHLELRSMRLPAARKQLRTALALVQRGEQSALEAVILNNLGIVETQRHRLSEARRCFRRAERLLLPAGERRAIVSIACNLAMIAAKQGDRREARAQIERASSLIRHFPGDRREFFVRYTHGVVDHSLGDAATAVESFEAALPLGRKAGDAHLVRHGEVYLAEAQLACGRYGPALRQLRATARATATGGSQLLSRTIRIRLALLEAILGRRRSAKRELEVVASLPPTDMAVPEAWNDLFLGLAMLAVDQPSRSTFEAAWSSFQRYRIPAGSCFAAVGLLAAALCSADRTGIVHALGLLSGQPVEGHTLLSVLKPAMVAEALCFLGDWAGAREQLSQASAAMVGAHFLELDWRMELLGARIDLAGGDRTAARSRVRRSLHARDLLLELVPQNARRNLLAHARFRSLTQLTAKLDRSPRLFFSTERMRSTASFEGLVGRSEPMARVFQRIDRIRELETAVLITGETGTGKELAARAIHRTSSRASGPFLALHCASLPQELFESELFGHEAGAFTGAESAVPGLLESLAGGTLLLDEVGELSAGAQAKLLKALESRTVRRLGSTEERTIDVRFLAASSKDLPRAIEDRSFRKDLFYRLARLELRLPPLRERREDIPLLARHFLESHARQLERTAPALEEGALRVLTEAPWPGNVRELESVLLQAVITLGRTDSLSAGDLQPLLRVTSSDAREALFRDEQIEGRSLSELRTELERAYMMRLFREVRGDLQRMMQVLQIKQSYFYTWLRRLRIDVRALRKSLGLARRR